MNKVFKVVFNRTTQQWTVTSELARGAVKSSSSEAKKPSLIKAVSTATLAMVVASASVTAVAFDDLELDFEMTDEQYHKNVAAQTTPTAPNTTPVTTPSHTVEIDGTVLPPATSPTPVHEVVIDGEVLAPAPKTEPMPSTPVTPPTSGHNVTIDADPNEVTNPTPNTMLATVAYVDAHNQAQDAAIATKADQSALNDLSQTVDAKADQVTLDALNEKVKQIDVAKATKQSVSAATTRIKEIQTQLTTLSDQVDAKADATTVTALTETVNTKASKQEVSAALSQVASHAESYVDRQDAAIKAIADKAQ
ncbi:ESPR domain-containing protein [Moraxella porci]|uniref:ESPR domain-containing protein n=1 Tax=Moraxella porci TaxID=1288392 RepID=UPI00244D44DD|nr:ESPR domain-containing protein [Moraxella porci]MDH2273087.1 ESPR-type extended signal peptide-containing protein [Moraxella porci]